jgi:predicted nucleic acid-binding protein
VDVLLPDESTPELYRRISAQLAQAGTFIPQNDIWIAAVAKPTRVRSEFEFELIVKIAIHN